jgi:decaprenylphospho-beta-D-ribofuranose 2-oxidase
MASSGRRRLVARGLGRAYGDAAQAAGGLVLDMTPLDRVIDSDLDEGWVRVEAGVSLDALMRTLVPKGWWVPVTAGTRHVTVGGAIAADIHGKNHHCDGSFCSYVSGLVLATPRGVLHVGPGSEPEVFWATAGGMGLTGVVLEATLRLLRIETAFMLVDTERADDLDDCLDRMSGRDSEYQYSVAWIDCLARGARLGRSVLTRAGHAGRDDLGSVSHPLAFDPRAQLEVPFTAPRSMLNPLTVSAFNEAWYRKAPRWRSAQVKPIASYFHPLDSLGSWNRLYGPRGFLQYQFVVPFGAEDTLRGVVERLSSERLASFLAVLKRFGPADPGPLSFPSTGWTLALDVPAGTPRLSVVLDGLDEMVAQAGGRVYLAKDSRLRPDLLGAMYPRLEDWKRVREKLDPDGVLASDLALRIGLVPSDSPAVRGHRFRGDPVGGDPVGGDPVGGDPVGGDPVGGDPVGGDPVGGDPVGGDPAPGDPAPGDPLRVDPLRAEQEVER